MCTSAQHYSDDGIANARREAVHQLLHGWVGPTAADLMSCGLGVPMHLVEPQLGCDNHNALVQSSLRSSHGAHMCPPPPDWDGAPDFTLSASQSGLSRGVPIALMHTLCGSDADESLQSGVQFNHWVPLVFEASFLWSLPTSSRGELDADAIQLFRPTAATRVATRVQAPVDSCIIDLTSSERPPHSPKDEAGVDAVTTVDDDSPWHHLSRSSSSDEVATEIQAMPATGEAEFGAVPAAQSLPVEDECVDVTGDFRHLLDQEFHSAEECITQLRAVSERLRCGLLVNRAKVSHASVHQCAALCFRSEVAN